MASRVMHLTVTVLLLAGRTVRDPEGVLFGALLPDAIPPGEKSRASHFVASRENQRTYDLEAFRRLYGAGLPEGGLYLGYYLHLVQDIAYRRLLYCQYGLRCRTPEELERLYRDYRILNGYLIDQYRLACPEDFPAGWENIDVCQRFGLVPQKLLEDLRGDFAGKAPGEAAFFSREMAEEYIQSAKALCERELDALEQGRPLLDPWTLAWNI